MIFVLLFQASIASLTIGSKDDDLDPGFITWHQQTWTAAPITLNTNHQGSLVLTFNFRAETAITNGVIQIICPSSLSCSETQTSKTFLADTDTSTTVSVTISTQGTYGPFGIATRKSSNGQLIDANYVFGSISVLDPISSGSMIVTNSDSSVTSMAVGGSTTLKFAFTLTVDLWAYDVIVLDIDQYYGVSSPVCTSVDISGIDNLLLGADESHTLECQADSNGDVFIYGIAQDVYANGSYQVEIQVTGFTVPTAVRGSASWSATAYRFGTETKVAQFTSSDTPLTINPGEISDISWSTVSGMSTSRITAGLTLFMELSFTTSTAIPASGTIELAFLNVNVNQHWYGSSGGQCLVSSHSSQITSCTVDSATAITIVVGNSEISAGSFTVITYQSFSSTSASIDSITTKTSDSAKIDEETDDTTTTYDISIAHQVVDLLPQVNDGTIDSNPNKNGYGCNHFMFKISVGSAIPNDLVAYIDPTGDQFSFTCPMLVSSGPANKKLHISSSATFRADAGGGQNTASTPITVSYSSTSITTDGVAVNLDAVTLETYVMETQRSTDQMVAPLVFSNMATFYECYFVSTHTTSGTIDRYTVGAGLLLIDQGQPTTFKAYPACVSGKGAPIYVTLSDDNIIYGFSSTSYQFQLTFDQALGLGIVQIPSYSSSGTITATIASDTIVTVSGFSSDLQAGSSLDFYLPSDLTATSVDLVVTSKIQYADTTYSTVTNFIAQKATTTTLAAGGTATASLTSPSTDSLPGQTSQTFQFSYQSAGDSDTGFFGIQTPEGQQISSAQFSSGLFGTPIILTSDDPAFTANVIFAQESSTTSISSGAASVSLQGLSTLDAEGTMSFNLFDGIMSSSVPDEGNCLGSATVTHTVTATQMAAPTVSGFSCALLGPTNYDSSMTITLTIGVPIPESGTITVVILEFTEGTDSTCESTSGTCGISSDTVTVTADANGISTGSFVINLTGLEAPSTGADTTVKLVDSVKSNDSGSNEIQVINDTDVGDCTLTAAGSTGIVSLNTANTYPNAAGLTNVDFYTSFSMSKELPSGSKIILEMQTSLVGTLYSGDNGDKKDKCWSSISYSSCQSSNGVLTLTIDQDYQANDTIELYLDSALSLSSTSGTKTDALNIKSTWHSNTVTVSNTDLDFVINEAQTGTLTPDSSNAISLQYTTAGEKTDYTFLFQVDTALDQNYQIWIVFPTDFSPYIGVLQDKVQNCYQDDYFLDCQSSTIEETLTCKVDHWKVIIAVPENIPASTNISLTVKDVWNPQAGVTSNFQLFVVGTDGVLLATSQSFGTVTTTSIPSNLVFKGVDSYTPQLNVEGDITLSFFSPENLDQNWSIGVYFPSQFDISITEGTESFTCSTNWYDQSSSSASKTTATALSTTETCTWDGNLAKYTLDSSVSFTTSSTTRIQLVMSTVINPSWGNTRTQTADDRFFDQEVDNETFAGYKYWTDRLTLYLFKQSDKTIPYKSYSTENSAYLGYAWEKTVGMLIDGYHPGSGAGSAMVYAGTQTDDITLELDEFDNQDWPLMVQRVQLSTSLNSFTPSSDLTLTSWGESFRFFYWKDSLEFRVAASSTASTGLYYIEWSLTETGEDFHQTEVYSPPGRFLVQVCKENAVISVDIADLPSSLYIGETSIPIKVQLGNAPASDLSVTITSDNTYVEVDPSVLTFEPDIDFLYFEIEIDDLFDTSSSNPIISFVLSGTDSSAYITPSSLTLSNIESGTQTDASLNSVQVSSVGKNTATASFSSDQDGIAYWYLGCEDADFTYQSVVGKIENLVEMEGHSHFEERLSQEYLDTKVNPDSGETIIDLYLQRLRDYCSNPYVNSQVVYSGTSYTVDFEELFDDTQYVFGVYVDNLIKANNVSDVSKATFSTDSSPNLYTLTLTIDDNINENQADTIQGIIAENVGINPDWLYNVQNSQQQDGSGNVQSSIFAWTVLYDDKVSDKTPLNFVSSTRLSTDAVNDIYLEYTQLSAGSVIFTNSPKIDDQNVGSFTSGPAEDSQSTDSIAFSLTTSTDGLVSATCIDSSQQTAPNTFQVLLGLDSDYQKADGWTYSSVTSTTATTITVNELTENTSYNCYFLICNDYDLKPTCSPNTVTVETQTSEDNDDGNDSALLITVGLIFFVNF